MEKLFKENKIPENSIDGGLIDCGCSSMQLETSHRGFSVNPGKDGPLDMRMGYIQLRDSFVNLPND